MVHRLIKPALLLGFLLVGNAAHAQGNTGRQGMLTCRTAPSLGLIIGSTKSSRANTEIIPAGPRITLAE